MRHTNSNLNILRQKRCTKIVKLNNFLKPPSSFKNLNSPMTTKNATNKNILYNLLYKDSSKISLYNTKNTTNTLKNINEVSNNGGILYSFNSKNLNNNSLSIGNSLNNKGERKKIRGHINIRLKLNDKIINNYTKKKSKQKTINMNIIEKIKEKDLKINKLQMDLLQSQELLNKLQKEKQKELSFTYNSIKSLDNINLSHDKKRFDDIFTQITEKNDRILKTNYNKYEMPKSKNKTIINNINRKNKKNKNNYNNNKKKYKSLMKINSLFNLNSNFSKNKNKRNTLNKNIVSSNSLSDNYLNINKNQNNVPTNKPKYFSPNSTNRFYKQNSKQYGSCISLRGNAFSIKKKKDKKIYTKKTECKIIKKIDKDKGDNDSLIKFKEKCEILKSRANKIISNYICLTEYIKSLKCDQE